MMKFSWRSDSGGAGSPAPAESLPHSYQSEAAVESRVLPGVTFRVRRMSFARRVELLERVRELAKRIEFLAAGSELAERIDAAAAGVEIDRLYLQWGLGGVSGLEIDGQPATAELLCERGPDALCGEIVAAVKAECGLTEQERKN